VNKKTDSRGYEHEQQNACSRDQARRPENEQRACAAFNPLLEKYISADKDEGSDRY
jgi:hypothetical protein